MCHFKARSDVSDMNRLLLVKLRMFYLVSYISVVQEKRFD